MRKALADPAATQALQRALQALVASKGWLTLTELVMEDAELAFDRVLHDADAEAANAARLTLRGTFDALHYPYKLLHALEQKEAFDHARHAADGRAHDAARRTRFLGSEYFW